MWKITEAERFWVKVQESDDGCWLWTGAKDSGGYGHFRPTNRRVMKAHRWSYEAMIGPIPEGLVLDHLCRVRRCVRPDHLEAVTQAENMHRGEPAQRTTCKYGHPLAKRKGQRFCPVCALAPFDGVRGRDRAECDYGHIFTPETSYVRPQGYRVCRECARLTQARYRARKTSTPTGSSS